jgi:hypothetical protein
MPAERDFDAVFATLAKLRAGALVIGPDTIFHQPEPTTRRTNGSGSLCPQSPRKFLKTILCGRLATTARH